MEEKIKVLVTDDQKENRLMVRLLLKEEGYDIAEAGDGLEAIEIARKYKPDIILIDAMMPKMDGFEAVKMLRELDEFKRTSILMLTALSDKKDKIRALNSGVNDFITKPFDPLELKIRCKSYAKLSAINKKYILSTINPITGLPNKTLLFEDLKDVSYGKFVIFRIKDYELLEEFYGREVMLKIKKTFANDIPNILSGNCIKYRYYHTSEAEFALLFKHIDKNIPEEVVENECKIFMDNLKKYNINIDNNSYYLNVVLSFYLGKNNLYENTRVGLNYAISNDEDMVFANKIVDKVKNESKTNIKMLQTIESAIVDNRVVSYFQPIYNNKTKQIEKYESLVRIIDENGDIIPPFKFLDIAKKAHLYTKISKEVLKNSFNALKKTTKDISINLSSLDLIDKEITDYILTYFNNNKELAKRVIFEFLEDESISNFDTVLNFINEVKKLGVKIAIDDFGSGYSNYTRILSLKPDILKIDGSLIKNLDTDNLNKITVETIKSFSKKLGIKSVAEFVHSQKILDIVNELDIEYSQGFFIEPPLKEIK